MYLYLINLRLKSKIHIADVVLWSTLNCSVGRVLTWQHLVMRRGMVLVRRVRRVRGVRRVRRAARVRVLAAVGRPRAFVVVAAHCHTPALVLRPRVNPRTYLIWSLSPTVTEDRLCAVHNEESNACVSVVIFCVVLITDADVRGIIQKLPHSAVTDNYWSVIIKLQRLVQLKHMRD